MSILHPLTLVAAIAAASAIMTGCAEVPPPPAPKDPVMIPYEMTADPVHVRTPSMYDTHESRGGAAIRQEGEKHVLWGEHYEAETNPAKLKAWQDEMKSDDALATEAIEKNAAKEKAANAAKNNGKTKPADTRKGKDASIYAKQK